ncbi:MAG: restriction endonuclease subunit S [Prolixibacteraceae bacterium]|nr:restriction endonuclease subunit S [Prolixibacteraceae bacterium]
MTITENIQYKTYPAYKDSGVEWLGEIPEHWKSRRLGTHFTERKTKVSDKDYLPLSVTKQGILPQLENAAKSNDGDNRKLVKEGDFVINSRSDRKGSSGIANENGSVSLINIVMKPKSFKSGYTNYLLKGYSFIEEFYRNGHGIVADLWTTRYDEMKNIKIPIPPLPEQTTIATFLDTKTAKIDRAIANKQKLIELLKERKQIIIQDAVTGKTNCLNWDERDEKIPGFDKNNNPEIRQSNKSKSRPMKDSGVEWIGEIPEGWEVKKLKYLGNIVSGYAFPSDGFKSEGVRVLKISNIQTMNIDWSDESYVDEKFYEMLPQFRIKEGDLVFALTRPIISSGIKATIVPSNTERILLNQRNSVLKPKNPKHKYWLYFVILDSEFRQEFNNQIDFTGQQPNISPIDIGNLKIPLPPENELQLMIKEVELALKKIDRAIALQQTQIEKLKEYKSVLIDSAVRGKIKVTP